MITAKQIKDNNLTEQDIVNIIMQVTGEDEITARFIMGMENGDIGPLGDRELLTSRNQQPGDVLPDDPPPDLV